MAKKRTKVKPLHQSYNYIKGRVKDLKAKGLTSTGMALISAITVAECNKTVTCKIIIYSDGMCNKGPRDDAFFKKIATSAKQAGCSVDIHSFKNSQSFLYQLKGIVTQTNGHLESIDPDGGQTQGNIGVAREIIGRECKISCMTQPGFEVVGLNEDYGTLTQKNIIDVTIPLS